jgi:hypothetical protein
MENAMKTAEELALEMASLNGELCAVVEWCVRNENECLADNPVQLKMALETLAKARVYYNAA